MTEQTPEQTAEPVDPRVQAWTEAAIAQEGQDAAEAAQVHLQRRVVALNVEVRHRDARIAELETILAAQGGDEDGAE